MALRKIDFYGHPAAALVGMTIYEQASRASGRTSRMIAAAAPGDTLLTWSSQEVQRLERLLRDARKEDVKVRLAGPSCYDIVNAAGVAGRDKLTPDHEWLRRYFQNAIEQAGNELVRCLSVEYPDTRQVEPSVRWGIEP